VEHADDAAADATPRERRLADEDERVERVAVPAERALDDWWPFIAVIASSR
jgi:hypothetical protein